MGELDQQVAVVTGGGSGIGRATVEVLGREGATVAVFDRDAGAARNAAGPVNGYAYELDVRDSTAVDAAMQDVAAKLGGVHILVNNAGLGDLRPLHTIDDKVWHRVLDVNLTGTFNTMRAAVPLMQEAGRGAIVNNASVSGFTPTRNEAVYSAAKAAVIALTKSGALEYGPVIRVNCVAPGYVRTPLTAAFEQHPQAFAPIADGMPMRRMGEASEIAEVIAFLCSRKASYVTGQTIVVDGGVSLPQNGTDAALAKMFELLSGNAEA
jgi:NAD(P)-dependent dehydrogenase (short-subunit alcohol dehydrogenase family)